jgi:SAM-dependent methyltransferase
MSKKKKKWANKATALFAEHMKNFSKNKVTDYQYINNGEVVTTGLISCGEGDRDEERGVWTNKELLTKFHPDKVNINEFWKIATKHYPHFSIAGGPPEVVERTPEEINEATLGFAHHHLGALQPIHDHGLNMLAPVLEIGPGYGGFKEYIERCGATWYGIDVNPLFKCERLHKCDGRTIPSGKKWMPKKFHMVYSMNVFQHLSVSQRDSYYQQAYNRLKDGGLFLFGLFAKNGVNRDWKQHWSTRDDEGNCYCHFFNQFTLIEEEEAIKAKLEKIGFEAEVINENNTHYRVFKCIKK